MSGKMHKYNEKKVKQPGKDYHVGEPVPGTGVTTKKNWFFLTFGDKTLYLI